MRVRFAFCCLLLTATLAARADVKLPNVLADHMVVQRDQPVHLWGGANPGEKVHAEFRGASADATADANGYWSLNLPKGSAGGPFTLTIKATNTIEFKDILVGDLWLIAGQSNVEYPMRSTTKPDGDPRGRGDLAKADYPTMRLLHIHARNVDQPQVNVMAAQSWMPANPTTLAGFSAVGFYFAKQIIEDQKVPIGMIEAATGGSAGEAWISPYSIAHDPTLSAVPENINEEEDHPQNGGKVDALTAAEIKRGNGINKPGGLFNGMIAPLTPLRIAGIIWYHGASNTNPPARARAYGHLLDTLIIDWRKQWMAASGEPGPIPFFTVQLANREAKSEIAAARDGQFHTMALPKVGLVVTIDIGDPKLYHPPDKMDIGHRTALWARTLVYNESGFEYSGPLFEKATPRGNQLVVSFTHATGLMAKGGKLTEWEVAGSDGSWSSADAVLQGDTVVVSSSHVKQPLYVRYCYSSAPVATLYNAANLPAAPFTSRSDK